MASRPTVTPTWPPAGDEGVRRLVQENRVVPGTVRQAGRFDHPLADGAHALVLARLLGDVGRAQGVGPGLLALGGQVVVLDDQQLVAAQVGVIGAAAQRGRGGQEQRQGQAAWAHGVRYVSNSTQAYRRRARRAQPSLPRPYRNVIPPTARASSPKLQQVERRLLARPRQRQAIAAGADALEHPDLVALAIAAVLGAPLAASPGHRAQEHQAAAGIGIEMAGLALRAGDLVLEKVTRSEE